MWKICGNGKAIKKQLPGRFRNRIARALRSKDLAEVNQLKLDVVYLTTLVKLRQREVAELQARLQREIAEVQTQLSEVRTVVSQIAGRTT